MRHLGRYKAHSCDAQTLPAEDLETLITDALLECYADSNLFTEAIEAHLEARSRQAEPLTEQLTAARAAIADKERIRSKYERDYESAAMTARLNDLEFLLEDDQPLPTVPTETELAELHTRLAHGVRHGGIRLRKALFGALVGSIEVHAADDIRPTFRLYDATSAAMLDALVPDQVAGQEGEPHSDGLQFASHRLGWS